MPMYSPKAPARDMTTFMAQLGSKSEWVKVASRNWAAVARMKQRTVVVAKRAASLVVISAFMVFPFR